MTKKFKLLCPCVAILLILFASCGLALGEEGEVPTEPIIFPPAAPYEITVSAITETSAIVSWTPVTSATGYSVWVDGLRYISSTSASAEIKGLLPYAEYNVSVTAFNSAGESGYSASIDFMTLPPAPGRTEILDVEVSGPYALVTWYPLPESQYIQSYRVYVDGELAKEIENSEGTDSAELSGLANGKHSVCVSGVNDNREGELSPLYIFETQNVLAPTGLTITNLFSDSVWVAWDEQNGPEQYKVYLDGQLAGVTPENRYSFENIMPGTQHKIEVSAILPDGNQSTKSELQFETFPVPEPLSIPTLLSGGYEYLNDLKPYIIALFAIGGAFAIARLGRIVFVSRRRFFRY
jgi:hypothetical protein